MTPQPKHSEGLIINYGDRSYIEGNAEYRGYDLSPYFHRCGIASVSPVHLGRIAWIRVDGTQWYGPCLVVDVTARHDAYEEIYFKNKIAELPRYIITDWFGAENGIWGYVYFGACQPPTEDWIAPRRYRPPLKFDDGTDIHPLFWPWPEQQYPVKCFAEQTHAPQ
jgi:hypothetical protein